VSICRRVSEFLPLMRSATDNWHSSTRRTLVHGCLCVQCVQTADRSSYLEVEEAWGGTFQDLQPWSQLEKLEPPLQHAGTEHQPQRAPVAALEAPLHRLLLHPSTPTCSPPCPMTLASCPWIAYLHFLIDSAEATSRLGPVRQGAGCACGPEKCRSTKNYSPVRERPMQNLSMLLCIL